MNTKHNRHKIAAGFIAAGITITASTVASTYLVKGIVTDATDNSPIPGAIVRVYAEGDTVLPILSDVTDSLGRFAEPLDSAGRYHLRAEFMGMKTMEVPFTADKASSEIRLDTISLTSSSEMLDELVVSVKKPLVESDGGTLTYNMSEDPMAQGNSVLEMLRKVPMVTVDAEENIKVKGNSNFKIYLNGREDPMLSGDPKTILKSMPASTIKKIEVITEPGAKYDAEGTAGILNIVTVSKTNLEGIVGNLSIWLNKTYTGASVYTRTKVGNVTGSANFSYSHSMFPGINDYTSGNVYENMVSETDRKQVTSGNGHSSNSYFGGGFSLSWEPDTLNLFTVEAHVGKTTNGSYTAQSIECFTSEEVLNWSYKRNWTSDYNILWTSANTSFQHTFGKEGHNLIGSYEYSFNHGTGKSDMYSYDFFGNAWDTPFRRNENRNHANQHTVQIDYANPLGEHNVLEAGGKAVWNRTNNLSAPWYGETEADMTVNREEEVSLAQFKNIQALYVSHTGKYGKWGTKVGLRFEHTETGIDYFTEGNENFSSTFNDLIPNAALTYRLTGMQNFRLSYQMRISRPGVGVLNPYVNTMTIGQVSYGNPNLDSERNNAVRLTYSNYGGKVGGSATLGYSHTGNKIESYTFAEGSLIHSTYANIGKYQDCELYGDLQWTIIPDMTVSLYGYIAREMYKAETELLSRKRNFWNWSYNCNFNYRLPCLISLSLYGGQGSAWKDLESTGDGWNYYGLSVSRGFLKDEKLKVNIYGQNFFRPMRTWRNSTIGDNVSNTGWYRRSEWYVGASVSFQFGKLNADVKRTNASIEAEGVVSGGSSSSGGGR